MESENPPLVTHKTPIYRLCSSTARLFCTYYCLTEIHGLENIPPGDGILLAGNHVSYLDGIVIGAFSKRHVSFMARASLQKNRFIGFLLRQCGAIFVDPDKGLIRSIKDTVVKLKAGDIVNIFPEGTRSLTGKIQPFKRGAILAAEKAGTVIIPYGLEGTYAIWPPGQKFPKRGKIILRFGTPISFDDPDREQKLFQAICELSGQPVLNPPLESPSMLAAV